ILLFHIIYIYFNMSINDNKELIQIAKALSDNARAAMIAEIAKRGKISCGEIFESVKLAQPTVSHHLGILERAGLINVEKNGRFLSISINKDKFSRFKNLIDNLASIK
ncbi:MAG TPA: metalloregulator ArsR/SmtB family transcription factor, partial [Ignavibacteriales bacterium]|nr:metalloregulator ArsR/SmtB family transcription factor [Ignavibacteriales bacterium]